MAASRRKLTQQGQLFVVQEIARFHGPSEVAAAVKENFGIDVSRQSILHYDPARNPNLAAPLKEAFEVARERAKKEEDSIGIAHKPYRLAELWELYRQAKAAKNRQLAAQLLEQAARECGGMFTNKRELSGNVGLSLSDAIKEAQAAAGEDEEKKD